MGHTLTLIVLIFSSFGVGLELLDRAVGNAVPR